MVPDFPVRVAKAHAVETRAEQFIGAISSPLRRKADALVFPLDPQRNVLIVVDLDSHDDAGAPARGAGHMERLDRTLQAVVSPIL